MTQKRGLGRGLGALIPGAGSSPAPEQELRTRAQRASTADQEPSSTRPVDMFFSGEKVSEDQDYPQRERGVRTDLAGEMARAAAQRRGRNASTRSTTSRGSAVSTEGSTETFESPTPAKPTSTRSTSKAGESSKSSSSKSSSSKASSTKSSTTKSTPAKAAPTEPQASKLASGTSAPAKASEKPTSAKAAPAKNPPAKSAPTKGASTKAAATPAKAAPAKSAVEEPTSTSTAPTEPGQEAPPAPPATRSASERATESGSPSAVAAKAPDPAASSTGEDAEAAAVMSEDVGEDGPAVAVEAVQPAPVRAEEAQPEAVDAPLPASAEGPPEGRSNDDGNRRQELVSVPGAEFAEIPIHEIRENPRNPRTMFDDDELDELAFSLREVGVLQPVVVRPIPVTDEGESFELVMGERRWRAARRAELTAIPAIIRETSDDDLLRDALLENLHRAQLNPLEEANAYQQLLEDFGCTQDELGERIGRSRPQITNTLRLLRLPALVQRRLASGALSAGHARTLLSLDDPALMEELAQRIVNEGLSVRAVERLVARGGQQAPARTIRRTTYDPHVVDLTSRLSNRLETPVRIDVGKRKGKITLEFTNLEDLDRLIDSMGLAVPVSSTDEDSAD